MATPAQTKIIDEFGALYTESQLWAPKQKRLDLLKEEIRTWYPNLPADETDLLAGNHYVVQVGQKSIEKDWKSMAEVYKAVGGLKAFLKICTVTFKALSGVIGNLAAEALQTEERSGSRTIKAVQVMPPVSTASMFPPGVRSVDRPSIAA